MKKSCSNNLFFWENNPNAVNMRACKDIPKPNAPFTKQPFL